MDLVPKSQHQNIVDILVVRTVKINQKNPIKWFPPSMKTPFCNGPPKAQINPKKIAFQQKLHRDRFITFKEIKKGRSAMKKGVSKRCVLKRVPALGLSPPFLWFHLRSPRSPIQISPRASRVTFGRREDHDPPDPPWGHMWGGWGSYHPVYGTPLYKELGQLSRFFLSF